MKNSFMNSMPGWKFGQNRKAYAVMDAFREEPAVQEQDPLAAVLLEEIVRSSAAAGEEALSMNWITG